MKEAKDASTNEERISPLETLSGIPASKLLESIKGAIEEMAGASLDMTSYSVTLADDKIKLKICLEDDYEWLFGEDAF